MTSHSWPCTYLLGALDQPPTFPGFRPHLWCGCVMTVQLQGWE